MDLYIENKNKQQQYKIYCDLDGCLANFEEAFKQVTGQYCDDYMTSHTKDEFWDEIKPKGKEFWSEIEWMPKGKELWNYIKQYKPSILSAPSKEKSSRIGKKEWVKKELPGVPLILSWANEKKNYATPTSILIDDNKKNISDWNEAGGITVLYKNTPDTIKQLKQLGL